MAKRPHSRLPSKFHADRSSRPCWNITTRYSRSVQSNWIASATGTRLREQKTIEHAWAAMFDAALADLLPVCIQDAGLVELHSPVHSNVESKLLLHGSTSLVMALDLRSQRQPCTGAHSTC